MTYNPKIDELVTIISKDRENPSLRLPLAQSLGIDDRTCRDLRDQALEQGYPIISTSSMAGSYMSYDDEDILKAEREAIKIRNHYNKKIAAYRRIRERKGQTKIDELV